MKQPLETFPGLPYAANEISAYMLGVETIYILSLKNGQMPRFQPDDVESFVIWLKAHKIREVKLSGQ
ncbi:hypothetical protein [Chitinophaga defluvii]|uniref:Uncharacterized protein n=1 Tax=Chitinophaga defluvii TaxID=3163343 RepID=A0ABV2TCD1_9BACT